MTGRVVRAATAGWVLALAVGIAAAGDPELGKFLLQSARADLAKKQYAEAIKKALAPGEGEWRKATDAYAAKLLAYAKSTVWARKVDVFQR